MRILYAYHSDDPTAQTGSKLGALSYHGPTQRGARRLYLIERVNLEEPLQRELHFWDLRNSVVSITQHTDLPPVRINSFWSQFNPTHNFAYYLRWTLVLFSHLCLPAVSGRFPSEFTNTVEYDLVISICLLHAPPTILTALIIFDE
jgi:hypothetical protein